MKYALATMVAIFALAYSVTAQTKTLATGARQITNFTASIDKADLLINWNSSDAVESNYWEVQGSADGKSFSTIGMVMGANPAATDADTYTFKQKMQKIKPGLVYFRVVHVEEDAITAVSLVQGVK